METPAPHRFQWRDIQRFSRLASIRKKCWNRASLRCSVPLRCDSFRHLRELESLVELVLVEFDVLSLCFVIVALGSTPPIAYKQHSRSKAVNCLLHTPEIMYSTKTATRAIISMRFVYLFAHPCVSSILSQMPIQIHHVTIWHSISKIRIALITAVHSSTLISHGRLRVSWYIHSRDRSVGISISRGGTHNRHLRVSAGMI